MMGACRPRSRSPGTSSTASSRASPNEVGRDHDVVLAITRGGLVPAGMLAYRLDLREILVAGAVFYLPDGGTHPSAP